MRRFLNIILICSTTYALSLFSGCALAPSKPEPPPQEQQTLLPGLQVARRMIVWIPLTDEEAESSLKLFEKYPRLRIVLAVSPRFKQFERDPALRAHADSLIKSGRLELALQLPNPPLLPLLVDSDSAREALPPGTVLPVPPYAYPDDVIQLVARAKADFFKTWKTLPRGLVLPYGAASPKLLTLFDRLGLPWLVAAINAPATSGGWSAGSLVIWDAAPQDGKRTVLVRLWDERVMRDPANGRRMLENWAKELEADKTLEAILPSDPNLPVFPLPPDSQWRRRTWQTLDWSTWIGTPGKNSAWMWLRKTREALEKFKNSGQASISRLDMAFEEFYSAQSASYFAGMNEDREREFKATLAMVYKLMGQNAPEDLFAAPASIGYASDSPSATTVKSEVLPDGRIRVTLEDPANDEVGGNQPVYDLRRLEVLASSEAVDFSVTLGSMTEQALVDVYMDMNRTPGVGTLSLLSGRNLNAAATDAWEYALTITAAQAVFYRTQSGGTYDQAGVYPVTAANGQWTVSIPRSTLRGNPRRWGYQVLVMAAGPPPSPVCDLQDPPGVPPSTWFGTPEESRRSDLPFVRIPAGK